MFLLERHRRVSVPTFRTLFEQGVNKNDRCRVTGAHSVNPRHLLHVFPGFAVGGSQMRFAQLAAGAGGRYRHTVLSLDGNIEMGAHLPADVVVDIVNPKVPKRSGFGTWMACRRLLLDLRPDLLVTYNWGSMDWCIANSIAPAVRHVHIEDGFGPEERRQQLRRRAWTRRIALSGGSCTVAVPSRSLVQLAREEWNIPARCLKYIPNGVDCTRFNSAPPPTRDTARRLVIGTVAALRPEKNLGRLIRMFNVLIVRTGSAALELVIVGDGPERAQLEEGARLGIGAGKIRFVGATPTPEAELAKFDIFVLTSDTEQMPLSVLEAMACGLPLVSFAVGDVPYMSSPENRALASISLDDDDSFIEKLQLLVSSPSLRATLGAANRSWAVKHFNQELMLNRYVELFG